MKRKKTLTKLSILLILLTPTIINAKEYIVCGTDKKFPTVIGTLISTVYVIIRILVPILLVISGILSFLKVTFSSNVDESLDKAKKKFISNIIAAIIIFFIASIINFVIGLAAGKNNSFTDCMYCMLHPDECKQIDSDMATLCPGLISDQDKYNSDCTLKDPDKKGEKIDYSYTGETGVPAYSNTIAKAGGGAIARSLRDNPNSTGSDKFKHFDYINGYSYYLYTPKQIDSDKAALIVYMHGTGGTGGGYERLKEDGGGGFLYEVENNNKEYPCYILIVHAPYVASTYGYSTSDVTGIINDALEKNNNIDPKRISIWGYSLGAEAVPNLVNANPKMFSSAVLLAIGYSGMEKAGTGFETVPTYGFYGVEDFTPAITVTPKFIETLKSKGYTAYLRTYPSPQGHPKLPNTVLEDTNRGNGFTTIRDWVLDQRRTD